MMFVNSPQKKNSFAKLCQGLFFAYPLGYFFRDLIIYPQPIPTNWPPGPVRGCWIDKDQFDPWRQKAFGNISIEDRMPVYGKIN